MHEMGFEARWENSPYLCCSGDTIKDVVGCILSMTAGKGKVFIYKFGKDGRSREFVKAILITD